MVDMIAVPIVEVHRRHVVQGHEWKLEHKFREMTDVDDLVVALRSKQHGLVDSDIRKIACLAWEYKDLGELEADIGVHPFPSLNRGYLDRAIENCDCVVKDAEVGDSGVVAFDCTALYNDWDSFKGGGRSVVVSRRPKRNIYGDPGDLLDMSGREDTNEEQGN